MGAVIVMRDRIRSRNALLDIGASGPLDSGFVEMNCYMPRLANLKPGQTVKTRVLQDGDLLQIGRYSFRYKEKQRS